MNYKKIYQKVKSRYIIVLIILVLLLASRQMIIKYQINLGKDMSRIINVSGRQRMLSQRITKDILMIYQNQGNDISNDYLDDLESSLKTWKEFHYNLIDGIGEEGLAVENSDIIMGMFTDINPYFENIFASANRIIDIVKQKEYNNDLILEEIYIVNENEEIFLNLMNQIVYQYDHESKNLTLHLERTEKTLFILIILSIIFIAVFIFLPTTKILKETFIDISESNEGIVKLFSSMKGALLLVRENGDVITMNSDAKNIISSKNPGAKNIKDLIKCTNFDINKAIEGIKLGNELDNIEVQIESENGDIITVLVSIIGGKYNREEVVLISAFDITIQKKAEEILKEMATKDELTGLHNRHFLESVINDEIERSERYEFPLSGVILDIDSFKTINDNWGHPVGDLILKEVSNILRENLRDSDYIIRIGGDEFVILMPHTDLEGAYIVAEKIRITIENMVNPIVGTYTCSFGVAERSKGESYSNLYNRMDNTLYKAKEAGRNRVFKSV